MEKDSPLEDERIKDVFEALVKAAKADGKITDEEAALLESVQINILVYDQALDEALDDGIITDDEKDVLDGLKQQIVTEAWDISSVSEGVSDDELKMLEIMLHRLADGDED